jgi:hypothetical protein
VVQNFTYQWTLTQTSPGALLYVTVCLSQSVTCSLSVQDDCGDSTIHRQREEQQCPGLGPAEQDVISLLCLCFCWFLEPSLGVTASNGSV